MQTIPREVLPSSWVLALPVITALDLPRADSLLAEGCQGLGGCGMSGRLIESRVLQSNSLSLQLLSAPLKGQVTFSTMLPSDCSFGSKGL